MSECKKNCRLQELFTNFAAADSRAGSLDKQALQTAADRLADFAAASGSRPCSPGEKATQDFVRQVQNPGHTGNADTGAEQTLYIISLFYDYLQAQGCIRANPITRLKRRAIRRLAEGLAQYGFKIKFIKEEEE